MPIKTLHLTNYWHERSGGIATFYRQLIAAANRQQRCMILVVPGEQNEVVEVGAYCRIYKIAAPLSPLNREYRTIYPREFLLPGSKIHRILADERPDVVEICDKYSLVHLGALLRRGLAYSLNFRPVVVGLTCERMDVNFAAYVSRSRWGEAFARFYMRHVYFPAFDHHITVSENTAAELKAIANGHLVPRGVWIRPMGVDVEHFSPNKRSLELRRQLLGGSDNPRNTFLLLYVGRLAPEKNLELLVATMAELEKERQDFRLVLAGDGIAREVLEHAAQAQAAGKVIFLGHVADREELARLYASCDLFVHPNPEEPFGIAPLEAMASGLPLIAPDHGGVTSYANESNAYLAPPTAKAFAQTILLACQSSSETARRAQAARETAEALSWTKVTDSFLRLYENLYDVGTGQQPMEGVRPAFISSNANAAQANRLRSAAQLAQASFIAYLWAGRMVASLSNRGQYQTALKDIRTS